MSSMNATSSTMSPSAAASISAEQAAALNGAMEFLLLTAICTGALIPVSIALLFSFSRLWRTPVFILNVFAIALGFTYGGLNINYLRSVFAQQLPSSRLTLVFMAMSFLIPVCVQSILILRVVAVYPPRMQTRMRNFVIYGVFIALSIGRIINMVFFLKKTARLIATSQSADTLTISLYTLRLPNGKAEWIMQSANDLYASTLFLLRLNEAHVFRGKQGGLASVLTNGGRNSYSSRLKALFWIAVFNFVFPVILNVIIVIFSFREQNVLHVCDVINLNIFVEIICVLLATVWCTGTYWGSPASSTAGASNQRIGFDCGETTESLASAKFAARSVTEPHFAGSDAEMVRLPK